MEVLKGQVVNKDMMRVLKGGAAKVAEQHLIMEAACNSKISGELGRVGIELDNGEVGRCKNAMQHGTLSKSCEFFC